MRPVLLTHPALSGTPPEGIYIGLGSLGWLGVRGGDVGRALTILDDPLGDFLADGVGVGNLVIRQNRIQLLCQIQLLHKYPPKVNPLWRGGA
ncbi:MAG: hypothetical protein AAF703_20230 [Cyanobacteria bacterium P01_D01_bin.105]